MIIAGWSSHRPSGSEAVDRKVRAAIQCKDLSDWPILSGRNRVRLAIPRRLEIDDGAGADIAEGVEVAVERAAGQLPVMLAVFHPSVLIAEPEDHLLDIGEELVSLIVRVFKLRVNPVAKRNVRIEV